jgi:hypothetical protein
MRIRAPGRIRTDTVGGLSSVSLPLEYGDLGETQGTY